MADFIQLAPGETDLGRIVAAIRELINRAPASEAAALGALLAANNLSDVADDAASFDSIKQAATTAYTGVVELATVAESTAGTDQTRAVTPEGLKAHVDAAINVRLAKTANYTVANADKRKTIALGGSGFFTLTFSAASGYDADFIVLVVNEDTGRGKTLAINGYSNFILWPGQCVIIFNQNNVWRFNPPGRWKLTAAQSWQVNHASGSNTGDGLSTGAAAFATIQFAINVLLAQIDPNGFEVKIVNAAETFTENNVIAHGRLPAANLATDGQDIVIEGDPATPTNVVWQVSAGNALFSISSSVKVNGFKLVATASGCNGFFAEKNGFINYFNMEFGAFASGNHIVVTEGGHCYFDGGSYTITGDFATHITLQGHGDVILISPTISIPNARTFTDFVDVLGPGWVQFSSASFTGTGAGAGSTGRKYNVRGNGVLSLAGATLPGATAGTTATGGQAL